jgi:hypothetical protein
VRTITLEVVSPLGVAGSLSPSMRPCSRRIATSGGPMAGSGDPFGAKWATILKRVTALVERLEVTPW